jgi:protein-histidine pros-kinase
VDPVGLRAKFNLAILVAFVVGFGATSFALDQLFMEQARQEVLQDAGIMMSAANAVRSFTATYVAPLAVDANQSATTFVAASVPSFAAQTTFRDVKKQFPDYTYREPTLNPTNPVDRANDWESDFIRAFRDKPSLKQLDAERETPTGLTLTIARPIPINDPACLRCHNTPAEAPPGLIATYGSANGFGWKLHEVVGAQVVSVPMTLPVRQAQERLYAFLIVLAGIFLLVIIILNLLLHFAVIKPALALARVADAVSLGDMTIEEYEPKGRDEIAVLSRAFNRMRRSLDSAMRMLDAGDQRE